MKHVLEAVQLRKAEYAKHPLFKRLEGTGTIEDAVGLFADVPFLVFSFQDMLRLVEGNTNDPQLRRIAAQHRMEDAEHDVWYLSDMEVLGRSREARDAVRLFSLEMSPVRDAVYKLISEIYRTRHDVVRVALIFAIEATGDCFFSRIPGYLTRSGLDDRQLQYFAKRHHEVEQAHEINEEQMHDRMDKNVILTPEVREEAISVCHRAFDCFLEIITFWEERIERRRRLRTVS